MTRLTRIEFSLNASAWNDLRILLSQSTVSDAYIYLFFKPFYRNEPRAPLSVPRHLPSSVQSA